MNVDLETIAKKVDALDYKMSQLEKLHLPSIIELDSERAKEAVRRYLKSSRDIRNLWKGELSAVEEVRAMRRHKRGY
jgi:hypothetical protein